jgi:hypothetical protein
MGRVALKGVKAIASACEEIAAAAGALPGEQSLTSA